MDINYKNQSFPVILKEEEQGGYTVINPAIEGCYSQGETTEEALNNIREATELCLEEATERNEKISLKNISLHLISLKNKHV
jgi:antitoxin HicB